MDVKLDLTVHAVVFILLTAGCAHLDARSVPLQRSRRQTSTAKPALKVTEYHVRCSVVSRYAVTTVESTVWNQLHIAKEAAFEVDLSSSAFISNFTITSNHKVYVAQVRRRTDARKIYDNAKKQGKTAGLVATKEREMEKFRVAVNVPPGARVSFSLSYEELLSRRLGRYELSLGLRPGQPVQNLSLEVSISERTGISFIRALPLRTSRLLSNTVQADAEAPPSTKVKQNAYCAHVRYTPSIQQQRNVSPKGLSADFIIQYDVELKDPMGDIQVDDGYFVHYFAPRGLPVVPKDVIFVIDISGSMIGTKIKQTKAAMVSILSDLREGDYFNLITFSDDVHTWKKDRTVRATRQNVRDAKEFVRKIIAAGWTNINAALLSAAKLLNPSTRSSSSTGRAPSSQRVPMIIFLTDGEATIGETETDVILHNAQKSLGLVSLFGLAFGDDADFPMLRRLALENRGVARMVYEDDDAAIQLKGFYDEVATPLLSDIQLSYLDDQVYDITRSLFPNYFQGSELVVTGRLKPGVRDLKITLTASDSKQKVKVENELPLAKALINGTDPALVCGQALDGIPSFVHRLWAYFTIKELLLAKMNTSDVTIQRLLVEKATNLSLENNFVTPVTSLVVIKPDIDEPEPTVSSSVITTTSKTSASTTAGSANMSNQTSNVAPKISSTSAMGTKKSKLLSPPKTSKPPVTKSVQAHPPLSGLHTTNRPPNASVSLNKTILTLSPKKTTTGPPKTTTTILSTKPSSSPPSTIKTTQTHMPPSTSKTSTSSAPVKITTLATLVKTAPSAEQDSSLDVKNSTNSRLAMLQQTQQTSTSTASTTEADSDIQVELEVATLMAPNFLPMPGMTDAPKLWEAARFLDVSSSIQIQRKDIDIDLVQDYDTARDYDYNIHYESYPDAEVSDPNNPPSLSSVRVFSSSVDGDPHFVIQLPKQDQHLCFTIDGRADDVLRLLEDPEKGIIVDGHLILGPPKKGMENRNRTFFDRISITAVKHTAMITLTSVSVVVEVEGNEMERLPTHQRGSVEQHGLRITVEEHHSCWIELEVGVRFLILFHRYNHPEYFQVEHLGFYIAEGIGLSRHTQGLLGQFLHSHIEVTKGMNQVGFHHAQTNKNTSLAFGLLKKGDKHLPVTLQNTNLKDSTKKRHLSQCWVVPKVDVERLLEQSYESYVVDRQ
ncbi:inter-alpha-trypsin inhibitor heavy chain H6 [Danio rerio]|uniref:Inter-alpha-trypsin inhibitor heavy chain H6 n=1 Tax=Danio rerio TaxID=7955 RepID=A0A8M3AYJ4_DANRE|nr:inter-alpha-trypsin inhibitor heavy chain H6 [Danio rerio]|eukprot:XP_009295210.1 inter-alpha-trypsin inhibitor heavy chain H6 [Danio rerio]